MRRCLSTGFAAACTSSKLALMRPSRSARERDADAIAIAARGLAPNLTAAALCELPA
jgi:hypothetical protein